MHSSRSELRRVAIMKGEEMPTFEDDSAQVCKNNKEIAKICGVPAQEQIEILQNAISNIKENPQPNENREMRRARIRHLESKIKKLKKRG